MGLVGCIKSLLEDGQVTLGTQLLSVGDTDDQESEELLANFYREEVLHLPGEAPPFDREAAVWAAKYRLVATKLPCFGI